MKSWKACVRTWEKSSRNNNTNDRTTSHRHSGTRLWRWFFLKTKI